MRANAVQGGWFPLLGMMLLTLWTTDLWAARPDDTLPVRGQWTRTAAPPLTPRNYVSVAWSGSEILVFGGVAHACSIASFKNCPPQSAAALADGAAYDPRTDTWRKIADAPAGIRGSATATFDGEVFVLATADDPRNPRLLRYLPGVDRWDEVPLPEAMWGRITAAGRGTLLFYQDSDQHGPTRDWALDLASGTWTQLPADPFAPGYGRQFVALGEDLYLFKQGAGFSAAEANTVIELRAARLRQGQWEVLPVPRSTGSGPILVAGHRIIFPALGCEPDAAGDCIDFGAVLDTATDSWHKLPNPPARGPGYVGYAGAFSGRTLVLALPGYPALDADSDEWFIVPALETDPMVQRYAHAAGTYGFTFGGVSATVELLGDAWIWKP